MGVSVRQKNGSWFLFIRHNGERAAKRYQDQDEAETVAKAVRNAITLGQFDLAALKASRQQEAKEQQVPTLKEYFEKSFTPEYLESGVRQSTRESYKGAFDRHILPVLGDIRLDELTRADVKAFTGSLTRKTYSRTLVEKTKNDQGETVRTEKKIERPFSKASIRIITASLCACLNHAREDGHIQENPANRLTKLYRNAKAMHPEIQPLTAEEAPLFLQAARQHTPDYYAMFLLLLHTGVRSGECAGLQWGDIDFNGKFVIVRRTVLPSGRIEKTKTDRVRRVDMSDDLATVLIAHRTARQKRSLKNKMPLPEWVFANNDGKPPDMHNVKRRAFLLALQKAGLRRIRMHDLRHSYASILISAGISPAYVQQQLGHASIKLTVDTYTHLIPGAGRQALKALPGVGSAGSAKTAISG